MKAASDDHDPSISGFDEDEDEDGAAMSAADGDKEEQEDVTFHSKTGGGKLHQLLGQNPFLVSDNDNHMSNR